MATKTISYWICDKCGQEMPFNDGTMPDGFYPKKWKRLSVNFGSTHLEIYEFCDKCSAELNLASDSTFDNPTKINLTDKLVYFIGEILGRDK